MSLRQDPNLLLETSFHEGFLLVVAAVVSMLFGLVLAVWEYRIGWVIGLFPSAFFLFLLVRRSSHFSRLLLTQGGFTYESYEVTYSFRWSDVEQFRVSGTPLRRAVEFSLTPAVKSQGGVNVLPEHYGFGFAELCSVLNEWRVRYSDRHYRCARRG